MYMYMYIHPHVHVHVQCVYMYLLSTILEYQCEITEYVHVLNVHHIQ